MAAVFTYKQVFIHSEVLRQCGVYDFCIIHFDDRPAGKPVTLDEAKSICFWANSAQYDIDNNWDTN